jgi:hypothetical protein
MSLIAPACFVETSRALSSVGAVRTPITQVVGCGCSIDIGVAILNRQAAVVADRGSYVRRRHSEYLYLSASGAGGLEKEGDEE